MINTSLGTQHFWRYLKQQPGVPTGEHLWNWKRQRNIGKQVHWHTGKALASQHSERMEPGPHSYRKRFWISQHKVLALDSLSLNIDIWNGMKVDICHVGISFSPHVKWQ